MPRWTWIVAAAALAAAALMIRGTLLPQPSATPTPPATPITRGGEVIAEGRVVPARSAALSVSQNGAGGIVAEVFVREGQPASQGQLLIRLEGARQAEATVASASANLSRAQARLAELRSGARAPEVAAARSALAIAEARHRQLLAGARPEERARAANAVVEAEGQARAAHQRAAQSDAELRLAESELIRTESLHAQGAIAQQAMEAARSRAQSARAALTAAHAQAASANALVASARQAQRLVEAGPRREEIEAAAAETRRARAQVELLEAGARPEAIAAAQADVNSARAAVRQAQAARAQSEVRAPFDGLVAHLTVKRGEFAGPGSVVAQLADLSSWKIETTDLTEMNIVAVRVGDPARVTFDAIPGFVLSGRVSRIRAFGERKQGDITYTVFVTPLNDDPRLKWNMTASVAIRTR